MLITSPPFKIIITLIIVSVLIFYPLHMAKAVAGWLLILKEFALDLIGRIIGRVVMSQMSNTVVRTLLTSGRDIIPGVPSPAFVQDWRDFIQTAQYRGEDLTRAIIADAVTGSNATICPYLRSPLATAFNVGSILSGFDYTKYRVDSLQYYKLLNRCTLPAGFSVATFQNDFTAGGGWVAWNQLIQPQNNFFGVYNNSLTELSKQRSLEENTDKSEAESGSGYTSKRTGCSGSGANRQCTILGKVLTPADLFGKSGAQTIDSEFGWLFSSDELQEALVSLAGIVANRLSNLAAGAVLGGAGALGPGTGESPPPANAVGQAQEDCVKSKEPACLLKAKKLDCDLSAAGGSGGSGGPGGISGGPGGGSGAGGAGGSGGSGGSASANCVEVIDQAIYDACMAEARLACGL